MTSFGLPDEFKKKSVSGSDGAGGLFSCSCPVAVWRRTRWNDDAPSIYAACSGVDALPDGGYARPDRLSESLEPLRWRTSVPGYAHIPAAVPPTPGVAAPEPASPLDAARILKALSRQHRRVAVSTKGRVSLTPKKRLKTPAPAPSAPFSGTEQLLQMLESLLSRILTPPSSPQRSDPEHDLIATLSGKIKVQRMAQLGSPCNRCSNRIGFPLAGRRRRPQQASRTAHPD
jgi:hypothetical protein